MELLSILLFILAIALYFLPTIIANKRRCQQFVAITLINIFLGLTAVGWLVSLIWAIIGETKEEKALSATRVKCLRCGSVVPANMKYCVICGTEFNIDAFKPSEEEMRKKNIVQANGWECVACGRLNYSYVGTCACGNTKNTNARSNAEDLGKNAIVSNVTGGLLNTNISQEMSYNSNTLKTSNESTNCIDDNLKDPIGRLNELKKLQEMGFMSEEEYEEKRKEIISKL